MGLFSRGDQPLLHQYKKLDDHRWERRCDGVALLKGDAEAEVKAATTVRKSPHIKPLARHCKDCQRARQR